MRYMDSAAALGFLIAANGGGAVIGGLIFAAVGHRLPRHAVFVGAFILAGLQFWVYLLYPSIAVFGYHYFDLQFGSGST